MERADEVNEAARLRSQLRRAKEALADAHMDLALKRSFLAVACAQMDQTVEGFKKTTLAVYAPGGPNPPGIESDLAL